MPANSQRRPSAAAEPAVAGLRKRPSGASVGAAPPSRKRPAAALQSTFTNPILPGGFPDPSICRVGDDFYLVNSSFELFPGLPIHHSRDLLNWELVGNALHRREQVDGAVNLLDVKSQDGIQAASLRHRDGTFYIITTCIYRPPDVEEGTCTNFVITATDIRGPWSLPHILEGAPGIDPDIFFDDDGKVWYIGTHSPDKPAFGGEGEIWCQELDLANFKLIGERHYLWRGACYGGVFVEGPHVYKHEGRYYLLVAEGGTGVNHAVMVASSDKVNGPYYPNERNPLVTSRNLSYDNWVHSTGHGDLFQLADGRWYMVLLGIRGDAGRSMDRRSNMGRETFLVPVSWEREPMDWSPLGPPMRHLWPVVAPETGRVERTLPVPFEGTVQRRPYTFRDDFDKPQLHPEWNFRRVPHPGTYLLGSRASYLRLYASPEVIRERGSCSLLGIRQRESDFDFATCMQFGTPPGVSAGICIFQKDDSYVTCLLSRQGDRPRVLRLVVAVPGEEPRCHTEAELPIYNGELYLLVNAREDGYKFRYSLFGLSRHGCTDLDFRKFKLLGTTPPDLLLSKGYTGAYLGLYCTTMGRTCSRDVDFADFDWVEQKALPRV